jgi:hypothetical protein
MKNFILLSVLLFSAQSFAAICSCDAPPSCGPRPGSCFQRVARDFLGKVFTEKGASNPTVLSFSDKVNYPNTVNVGWGRNSDGMPFGTYYVAFTSENTFSLFLAPFNGQRPSLVEEFEFAVRYYPTQIDSLQTQDGRIFLIEKQ